MFGYYIHTTDLKSKGRVSVFYDFRRKTSKDFALYYITNIISFFKYSNSKNIRCTVTPPGQWTHEGSR